MRTQNLIYIFLEKFKEKHSNYEVTTSARISKEHGSGRVGSDDGRAWEGSASK